MPLRDAGPSCSSSNIGCSSPSSVDGAAAFRKHLIGELCLPMSGSGMLTSEDEACDSELDEAASPTPPKSSAWICSSKDSAAHIGRCLWAIHRPQQALVQLGKQGLFTGRTVLDIGCGIGDNALYLQKYCGSSVVAMDNAANALEFCRAKEAQREKSAKDYGGGTLGATGKVKWALGNVLDAGQLATQLGGQQFDVLLDVGTFHFFSNADRKKYLQSVSNLCKTGGRLYLMAFSDKCIDYKTGGPRRMTRADISDCFNTVTGWEVVEVRDTMLEHHPSINQEGEAAANQPKTFEHAWRGYAESHLVIARKLTHGPAFTPHAKALHDPTPQQLQETALAEKRKLTGVDTDTDVTLRLKGGQQQAKFAAGPQWSSKQWIAQGDQ